MYYQGTVFEPRRHQTRNDLGQLTKDRVFRITPTLVANMCSISVHGELK